MPRPPDPTAALGAALLHATGPATAGEVTGDGGATQGPAHANSICTFSGLADGGEGEPAASRCPILASTSTPFRVD